LQFRWLENEWNASSEKLELLLTWQARVPKIGTLAAHALSDIKLHMSLTRFIGPGVAPNPMTDPTRSVHGFDSTQV